MSTKQSLLTSAACGLIRAGIFIMLIGLGVIK